MKIDQVRVVNSNNYKGADTVEVHVAIIIAPLYYYKVGKTTVSKRNNKVGLFRIHFSWRKNIHVRCGNKFRKQKKHTLKIDQHFEF